MALSSIEIGSGADSRDAWFLSCLMYHGVCRSDRFATRTSVRSRSTSCKYHSGKVSLSPLVNRMPFSATLLSMLYA